MSSETDIPAESHDLSAAEYVLGVQDVAARADAETRIARDPAFAREVEYWQGRLTALVEEVGAVEPPTTAWALVERATGGNISAFPGRDPVPADRRLNFWRAWALGASAVAAASLLSVWGLTNRSDAHMMTATIKVADSGAPDVVVSFDPKSQDLILTPVGDKPPVGQVPHLWLMKRDGSMQLIGPLSMDHSARRHISDAEMAAARGTMGVGISLEPAGVAPRDRPTGPIVAQGAFVKL